MTSRCYDAKEGFLMTNLRVTDCSAERSATCLLTQVRAVRKMFILMRRKKGRSLSLWFARYER